MTNQQHPITPSDELVWKWRVAASNVPASLTTDPGGRPSWSRRDYINHIVTQAARWGDDQRLEAVCEWLNFNYPSVSIAALRTAMRPKSKSIKERLIEAINGENLGEALRLVEQLDD